MEKTQSARRDAGRGNRDGRAPQIAIAVSMPALPDAMSGLFGDELLIAELVEPARVAGVMPGMFGVGTIIKPRIQREIVKIREKSWIGVEKRAAGKIIKVCPMRVVVGVEEPLETHVVVIKKRESEIGHVVKTERRAVGESQKGHFAGHVGRTVEKGRQQYLAGGNERSHLVTAAGLREHKEAIGRRVITKISRALAIDRIGDVKATSDGIRHRVRICP